MKKTPDLAAALTQAAGGATSTKPATSAASDRKVLLVRLDPGTFMRRLQACWPLRTGHHGASGLAEEAVDLTV